MNEPLKEAVFTAAVKLNVRPKFKALKITDALLLEVAQAHQARFGFVPTKWADYIQSALNKHAKANE